MELSNEELYQVTGGASKYAIAFITAGVVTFIVGIVDGFLRPLKCRI